MNTIKIWLSALLPLLLVLAACEEIEESGGSTNTDTDLEVVEQGDDEDSEGSCAPVAPIQCGQIISGDTSDFNGGATTELDNYSVAVGNYGAAEITYSFSPQASGEVTLRFIDPDPTEVNHDIFLLDAAQGCTAGAAIRRGFNALAIDVEAGEDYFVVIDGMQGNEGEFALELVCPSADEPIEPNTPPEHFDECLFGWTSSDLSGADHLTISLSAQFESAQDLPDLVANQLISAINNDGWASVATPEDVFAFVDYDGVYQHSVIGEEAGQDFTWLLFYAGDTEVGYLYRTGTLEVVAIVSDGDVHDCEIPGL